MRQFLLFMLILFCPGTLASYAAAIHDAAKKGDLAAITAALDTGADINAEDGGGTPLYFAARRGHLAATQLLIERGANVNSRTSLGQPLEAAVEKDRVEIITLLLSNGADPNSSSDTKTVLHIAAERGCLGCVKALVEAGADVNAQQKLNGEGVYLWIITPLHLAVRFEHYEVADYLRAHGVVIPKPAPISAMLASADPSKGQQVIEKWCLHCHNTKIDMHEGQDFGPNLWNVVGRDKASLDFSSYSKTLRALEGVWTYEDLNTFLSGPAVTTPGTRMQVQGVLDETDRVNLIAYLRTLSDKPIPLP
jgi:cytochrome c